MLKLCPVVPYYAHIKLCLDCSVRVSNTSMNVLLIYGDLEKPSLLFDQKHKNIQKFSVSCDHRKRRSEWAWQEVFKYKYKLPTYKNKAIKLSHQAVNLPDTAVPGHKNLLRTGYTNSSCTVKDMSDI